MAQVPREQRVPRTRSTVTVQHQVAAVATGDGVDVDIRECESGSIQIEGVTTAGITFEATVDGVTWYAIAGRDVANVNQSGTVAVSVATNVNGIWYFNNLGGVLFIRARISAWTAGTINVWGSYF